MHSYYISLPFLYHLDIRPVRNSFFGHGNMTFLGELLGHFDNLYCDGTESSLLKCRSGRPSSTNQNQEVPQFDCSKNEVAGVRCEGVHVTVTDMQQLL